ncbi:hypothetical protein M514_00847 [Trichuris suis]|uniref:Uncharacterized protein n=1 Tax=Trichuris suis TaxID=68888 RepID=A0A085MLI8_9BILA|nr:hypothetical protein M513_00847 [Trichuris suis]KFD61197.1 hypothetical protein M514_00847 [Trichuris suis]
MLDRSEVEAAAAHVESSGPVGRRAARGRRRRSISRAPSGQRDPSSGVSHPHEVTMNTVSAIVSEIKTHLSTLFNELRLTSSPPVGEQFAANRRGRHSSVESCSGVPNSHAGAQVTTSLPSQSFGWQGANSLQEAKGAFPPTAISVKQVCSQDNLSRIDDWIRANIGCLLTDMTVNANSTKHKMRPSTCHSLHHPNLPRDLRLLKTFRISLKTVPEENRKLRRNKTTDNKHREHCLH